MFGHVFLSTIILSDVGPENTIFSMIFNVLFVYVSPTV